MGELSRKLLLTGVINFIKPGYVTQVWFAILFGILFLLVMTFFTPFKDERIDFISFIVQLCTVLTLIVSVGLEPNAKPNVVSEGVISKSMMGVLLSVFAIVPLVLGCGLFVWA